MLNLNRFFKHGNTSILNFNLFLYLLCHVFLLQSTHSEIGEAVACQSKCKKDGQDLRLDREELFCYNNENMVE